ncbi:hypothetical protein V6N13_054311 [Hibiscus sabdariffa]
MKVTAVSAADSCFGDDLWPPGFRFHPTDEELVLYYLKRKICNKRLKIDIISETDIYKWDPEELPGQSILKSGDRQWFFFCPRDRKYPNGARSNRATIHGYWKTTGKDRTVTCSSRTVGMKKTLVFYRGRAPRGDRTDWVMHEYTLNEEELKRCQNVKDYYALYKLYKKSGPGPKNGEQYGAPFKEEVWAAEEYDSNPVDTITPVKPAVEIIPGDNVEAYAQDLSPSSDIKEFIRQLLDEPPLPQPEALVNHDLPRAASVDHFEHLPQLCEVDYLEIDDLLGPEPLISDGEKPVEKVQFNEVDELSELDLDLYHDAAMFLQDIGPIDQGMAPPSYDNMILQAGYQLESQSNISLMDQQLQLQMNGSGDNMLSQVGYQSNSGPNVNVMDQQLMFYLTVDQMGYHGQNQQQQLQPQMNSYGDNMLNQVGYRDQNQQLQTDQINGSLWAHDQSGNVFSPSGSNLGNASPTSGFVNNVTKQDQGDKNEGGGGWFSSSLWSFVESIPTTPASASERPLVNPTFERMSSSSKLKLNASVSAMNGSTSGSARRKSRNKGFFIISVIGAVCAVLWFLMGTVRVLGKPISRLHAIITHLNNNSNNH